jgi:N-acetylneuraminic acid mutarotase
VTALVLVASVLLDRMVTDAGRAAGEGNFRVAEVYDPGDGRWHRVPAMRKPRGGIAAATVDDRIVVLGGEEGAGTIREVELYDPRRRRWIRLPDLATPRHGLGAAARGNRVYAIEGGDEPGFHFTDVIEALDVR